MKSTIILAAASLAALTASTAAFADDHDKVSKHELAKDRAKVDRKEDQLNMAQAYGSDHDVRRQERQLDKAHNELRRDRRDAYRAGLYARPVGWRERAWATGDRLPASYYARTYWVEPSRYSLTPVQGPNHWVRVDHDVFLVAPDGTVREVRRGWFY